MVKVDMTQPDRDLTPGVDLWEVKTASGKESSNGTPMISLEFKRVSGQGVLWDNVMLGGGGWGIGKAKLSALGVPKNFTGDLNVATLVGRRVWVATVVDEYQGKSRLKVDIAELDHAGYQDEKNKPAGAKAPPAERTFADTPRSGPPTDEEIDSTPF